MRLEGCLLGSECLNMEEKVCCDSDRMEDIGIEQGLEAD
jgi:hypothetical protein